MTLTITTKLGILSFAAALIATGCGSVTTMCDGPECECQGDDCPVIDCAGVAGGAATEDLCGVCDSDPTNDCQADCSGEFGGTAAIDACGQCAGGSTDVLACTALSFPTEADASVASASPNANFGTSIELVADRGEIEIFLRFDLGELARESVIRGATLRLTAFDGSLHQGEGTAEIYFVGDDSWEENAISWSTKPGSSGGAIGTWTVAYESTPTELELSLENPALIAQLQAESFARNGQLSLVIRSPLSESHYRSRESADPAVHPTLDVVVQEGAVLSLEPVADAYVRQGAPTTNFGLDEELRVDPLSASGGSGVGFQVFMRYDLRQVPAGDQLPMAQLHMQAHSGFAYGGDGNVYTHLVADDSWQEEQITWNTRPGVVGEALGYWWLWYNNTPADRVGRHFTPELATAIRGELVGDGQISFRLFSPGYQTRYRSREYTAAEQRPRLEILHARPLATQ